MSVAVRHWTAAVLAVLLSLCAPPAWPADHALLVGVADYPQLPRRLWLHGPVNDVALMRKALLQRGFVPGAIRALVSRSNIEDEPTREHIVGAMRDLLTRVHAGDRVVFYLAGHGSQQPQPTDHRGRPTEPDGMDEVFLPSDVRQWDGSGAAAAIPNALLDDEIGEWMDAVVDRGATVWAIFDTCHAAGMARGRGARWRAVAPADLGLPAGVSQLRAAARAQGRTDGRTLAFASRTNEPAGEEWFRSVETPRLAQLHGVFTFHLAQLLRSQSRVDTRMLAAQLRARYAADRRTAPTPVFLGRLEADWP